MVDLRDALIYVCNQYPPKLSLPITRLTQVVYLADWRCSIAYGHTLTRVKWFINEQGVYTTDIAAGIQSDPTFSIVCSRRLFRIVRRRVTVRHDAELKFLSKKDAEILSAVMRTSATRSSTGFLRIIDSTYPCRHYRRDFPRPIDLVALAHERKYGTHTKRLIVTGLPSSK